jgi:hypothetical protein
MIFSFYRFFFLSLLFFLICVFSAFAQPTGSMEGMIVDTQIGDPIIGANVMLQGTSLGASTNLDGTYRIPNIPAGNYVVIVSCMGYTKLTVNNTAIDSGRVLTLNLHMREEALNLQEVVIEAKEVNNTEASLLTIQKRAPVVSDGISLAQIKKSPDSDASAAVKRITGVTVVGNKYVYVRGMGERYNNTRLNGIAIASPEPLKRTVPFDIIPTNLLDNVIVTKTATPDQPGDFSGGSVQLNTREFPEKLSFSASASSSYNSESSFKDFYSYAGGNKDWLAMDDGTRSIPDFVANGGWLGNAAAEKQAVKSFNNYTFSPTKSSAPLNGTRSLSLGNQTEWFGKPLGYLVSLNYSDNYARQIGEQNDYTLQQQQDGSTRYDVRQNLMVDRSIYTVSWGGIMDLNTRFNNNNKLSLKTLYTRSADNESRIANGVIEDIIYKNYRLTWTERSILSTQLKGAHEFSSLGGSRLEWTSAYSRSSFDQPDRRELSYDWSESNQAYQVRFGGASGIRRFANMKDNVYEEVLDWTLPLDKLKLSNSKIKFGGLYRYLDRSFPTKIYYFQEHTTPDQPQLDATLPPDAIFTSDNLDRYFFLDANQVSLDSYDAQMSVKAGYLMGDVLLGNKWRVIGGVRVEDTDQHYKSYPYEGSISATFSEGGPKHTDVLPSLNLTYKLNDKINLRAAGSMTIANPDYAEIVPTTDQEFIQGRERTGNPKIKHSKILNFDLRSEYYPSVGENLSAGVFYKDIKDPIEWVLTTAGATQIATMPENFAHAHNLGAELEFRKSFDMLASKLGTWASYFSLLGNLTYVSSDVKLTNEGQNVLTNKSRPLIEQSRYVVNTTLAFDHPRWGSSIRLLYNTFGKRISAVGALGLDDTYEMPFDKLDLSLNQRLDSRWSLKFQGTNLLNSSVEFRSRTYLVQKYSIGRTYTLGVAYSIQ